jgi:F-type H+-transporting ATPase subunit b
MVMRLIAAATLVLVLLGCSSGPARAEAPASESVAGEKASAEGHGSEKVGADALNPVNVEGKNFAGDLTVWTAVVFVVVLLILWKAAWKPISQGLEAREGEIAHQIREAQEKNEEARRLLADYEKRLAAAGDEVRAILDDGRRKAEAVGRELLDKAKEESAAERQRAVQQIEAAAQAATKDLAERSAAIAVELAGKIVRSTLRPQDHARLIQEAVTNFSALGNGSKN